MCVAWCAHTHTGYSKTNKGKIKYNRSIYTNFLVTSLWDYKINETEKLSVYFGGLNLINGLLKDVDFSSVLEFVDSEEKIDFTERVQRMRELDDILKRKY